MKKKISRFSLLVVLTFVMFCNTTIDNNQTPEYNLKSFFTLAQAHSEDYNPIIDSIPEPEPSWLDKLIDIFYF